MKKCLCLGILLILLFFGVVRSNSLAQGITFSPSIRVDDDTTEMPQAAPCIAAYGDSNIYIAWCDWRDWHSTECLNLYFSSSFDGGRTWTKNINITNNSTPAPYIQRMETDNKGNIYLVWGDEAIGNIYFSFSSDSGKSWAQPVRVNDVPGCAFSPHLAVDDEGIIYMAWSDERNDYWFDVYFAKSADCGFTWTTPAVRVNDYTSGFQGADDIVVHRVSPSQVNIYVGLTDFRSGHEEVFFSKSQDGGKTWGRNVKASDTYWAGRPKMGVDPQGTIHLIYNGRQPDRNPSIFYTHSTDEGSTWATPNTMVSPDTFDSQLEEDIAVDRYGNLYAVWKASPVLPNNQVDYHIYFALSQDGGQSWSDPIIRVDDSTMDFGDQPCISLADDGRIYVAWDGHRETPGAKGDIFFSWAQGPDWVRESRDQIPIPRLSLGQNYPNPFNAATTIPYHLSAVGRPRIAVTLRVYNLLGQEVRTLVNEVQKPGRSEVVWDGKDKRGKEVSSGVYFCRLEVMGNRCKVVRTRKMLLLR